MKYLPTEFIEIRDNKTSEILKILENLPYEQAKEILNYSKFRIKKVSLVANFS